jgi:hypothetical protein
MHDTFMEAVALTKGVATSLTVMVVGWWYGSFRTTPVKVCTPASTGVKV